MAKFDRIEATADCPDCGEEIIVSVRFKFVRSEMPDGSRLSSILASTEPFSHVCGGEA